MVPDSKPVKSTKHSLVDFRNWDSYRNETSNILNFTIFSTKILFLTLQIKCFQTMANGIKIVLFNSTTNTLTDLTDASYENANYPGPWILQSWQILIRQNRWGLLSRQNRWGHHHAIHVCNGNWSTRGADGPSMEIARRAVQCDAKTSCYARRNLIRRNLISGDVEYMIALKWIVVFCDGYTYTPLFNCHVHGNTL